MVDSVEREVKLKCEFAKEDPEFLSDKIVVPNGFMEMVDDLIYAILLKQPEGGSASLTKFARQHFSDLLLLITSNTDEILSCDSTAPGSKSSKGSAPSNTNYHQSDSPMFTPDMVIIPEGLEDLVDGLVHRGLSKKRDGNKLGLVQFAFDHFNHIYNKLPDWERGSSVERNDPQERGESQEKRDSKTHGDSQELRDSNARNEFQERIGSQELRDSKERNEFQERMDSQEPGDSQGRGGSKEQRDSQEGGETQERRDSQEHGESQEQRPEESKNSNKERRPVELINSNKNSNHSEQGSESALHVGREERRLGISGENFSPDGKSKVSKYPKDAKTMAKLKQSARDVMPLKHLDEQNLESILEVLKPMKVKAGELVTKEGDDGNDFYIIETGTFNIYKREEERKQNSGEKGKLINTLKQSGAFGELALLYNWPRQATVEAVTDGSLWVLDRASFQIVSGNAAFEQRRSLQQIMGKIEMLKQLKPEEIMNLCDAIQIKNFDHNVDIIKQNDRANSMFFLMEGEAVVSMTSPGGETKEIKKLSLGSYFGEMALITMEKRKATVKANGKVRCGELSVDAFERLLGPCKEIMRRNQSDYDDQVSQVFKT